MKDKQLQYLHISKTAGTSIENSALKFNYRWGKQAFEFIWKHVVKNCKYNFKEYSAHHIPISFCTDVSFKNYLNSIYNFFTVVRNPYDRCISEYFCNFNNQKIIPAKSKHINEYICFNLKNLINKQYRNDGHFIQQSEYCEELKLVKILKYENLENEFNNLMFSEDIDVRLDNFDNKSSKNKIILFDKTIYMIQKTYYFDFVNFKYNFNPESYYIFKNLC